MILVTEYINPIQRITDDVKALSLDSLLTQALAAAPTMAAVEAAADSVGDRAEHDFQYTGLKTAGSEPSPWGPNSSNKMNSGHPESGYIEFSHSAEFDREFRKTRLGVDNLTSHRTLYAHIHRQFCEAVAFFTVCRRDPAVLLGTDGYNPLQGWIGWLAESAEFARAGFDSTSEGYDLADEFYAALIGDEGRARANFGCLALLARDFYEMLPSGIANYLAEPSDIERIVDRLIERYPPPRSEAVVLVGEIAMLLAMVPEGPELDRVTEMLGFPPGRRVPWRWRIWLDQLSGTMLSRLNGLPGC